VQDFSASRFVKYYADNPEKFQELVATFHNEFPAKEAIFLAQLDQPVPWGLQAKRVLLACDNDGTPISIGIIAAVRSWGDFFKDAPPDFCVPDNVRYQYGACIIPRARGLGIANILGSITMLDPTAVANTTICRDFEPWGQLYRQVQSIGCEISQSSPFRGQDGNNYKMKLQWGSPSVEYAEAMARVIAEYETITAGLIAAAKLASGASGLVAKL
jgi:hypothetical protein